MLDSRPGKRGVLILLKLGAVIVLLSPAILVVWLDALLRRRWLARPRGALAALRRLGLERHGGRRWRVVAVRPLGGGQANVVVRVTLRAGRRTRHVVLKQALAFGSLLAWFGRHLGPMPYPRRLRAEARIAREVRLLRRLRRLRLPAPACLGWDVRARLLALEWVEGVPVATAIRRRDGAAVAASMGRTLARCHRRGVALCDGHPGNALLRANGEIVLCDLEFAAEGRGATPRRAGFDLAYCAALMPDGETRAALLSGYGPRGALDGAVGRAQRRLERFAPLLERERGRWAEVTP